MRVLLLLLTIDLVFGATPITNRYHETVGIKAAERIKAAEEAGLGGARIVGGAETQLGRYPHVGGLVIELTTGITSVCTSSLISSTRLVTAAHCWTDGAHQAAHFVVVLGSITLFEGGTRIVTDDVETHPQFDRESLNNDVGIARIPAVQFNNYISPISLASVEVFGDDTLAGQWGFAAGYGRISDASQLTPAQSLHAASLEIITNSHCEYHYGGIIVVDSTICASGYQGRGTCSGDSGGPLEVVRDGRRWLVGITSFNSNRGCQIGFPSGFARVTHFTSWFTSRM